VAIEEQAEILRIEGPRPASKATFNEERKLTATFINGTALAVLTIGGFSPIVLVLQEKTVVEGNVYFALGCLALSFALHLVARSVLKGMID